MRRILRLDLHYHPYKMQVVQALNENDLRTHFQNGYLLWLTNLWISDEAIFVIELTQPPSSLPATSSFCKSYSAISSSGIIGPFFFRKWEAVTVSAEQYSEILRTFFIPPSPVRPEWRTIFPARWSNELYSQNEYGPSQWRVSKSCNLSTWSNPMAYSSAWSNGMRLFLVGLSQEQSLWATLRQLKEIIRQEITRIPQQMLRNVIFWGALMSVCWERDVILLTYFF